MSGWRIVGSFIWRNRLLPHGYYTVLKEKGAGLSAGERQLLSFARTLVTNPRIFTLDEETAHIDPETEAIVQKAMHEVSRGRTLLVIAHRFSTIRGPYCGTGPGTSF